MMKKIRTGLALLIVLGFISTLVGGVGYVYGNPDGVTDNFDNENYIASKTNLVVTGGQVKLEEVVQVCYSGGSPQTTGWGSGLYGCSGEDKRCYNGLCKDCSDTGGYLYDDGCGGCAGQGGNACWRKGVWKAGDSCNTACGSYGGCVEQNWNDDSNCSVTNHWSGCSFGCTPATQDYQPSSDCLWCWPEYCHYRQAGYGQLCSTGIPAWGVRMCVCNY